MGEALRPVGLPRVPLDQLGQLAAQGWCQVPGWPMVGASHSCVRVGTDLLDAAGARALAALILAAAEEHERLAS